MNLPPSAPVVDVQHVEKTRVEHLEQKVGVTLALLATPPEVVYQRSSPESYLRVSLGGCCKFLLEALSHVPDVKCMKDIRKPNTHHGTYSYVPVSYKGADVKLYLVYKNV